MIFLNIRNFSFIHFFLNCCKYNFLNLFFPFVFIIVIIIIIIKQLNETFEF